MHTTLQNLAACDTGTPIAARARMIQRCAYYLAADHSALRMDLTELEPAGPFRLIVEGAETKHIEYFDDSAAALERWAEFDAAMRPVAVERDLAAAIH